MRLTTKGRFAVTAMVDLSMRQTRGPVTLAAISERQHISRMRDTNLVIEIPRYTINHEREGGGKK